MSLLTSGSAFSLMLRAHEVCFTKRLSKPTFGSGIGRLSSISRVMRWQPLRIAFSWNSVCCIIFNVFFNAYYSLLSYIAVPQWDPPMFCVLLSFSYHSRLSHRPSSHTWHITGGRCPRCSDSSRCRRWRRSPSSLVQN